MGKIDSNVFLGQLRGRISDLVFRRYGNTTVVYEYNKPDKWYPPTVRQQQKRERFKAATEYARKAMRDPELKIRYQLKARELGKGNAYNAAMKDFLNSPTLNSIELFSMEVVIDARDDFQVSRVEVKVLDGEGAVLEEGNAALLGDGLWHYYFKPGAPVHDVAVTAFDVPGNSVQGFAK